MRSTEHCDDRHSAGAGGLDGRLLHDAVRLVLRAVVAARDEGGRLTPTSGAPQLNRDKVDSEAAMLLRAALPLADRVPGLRASLTRLGAELATPTPSEVAVRLCLHPGVALDLALVPLHLSALGLGDPSLEPLLEDLFGHERLRGPERPPHRELEQQWLHGLWSGGTAPAELARAVSASCLGWEFDHLAGTTDDAYAFTHAILYASDHGRRRVALPRPVPAITADAEAILAVALDAGNHDVAAEALWTWTMLGLDEPPLAARARDLLGAVSSERGFLPGPGFDPAVHEQLPLPERDAYVLRTSYHTTLVHGLLLASVLDGGPHRPGRAPRATPARPGAASALLPYCPPRPGAQEWWGRVGSLPAAEQDALAPALAAMALRRAAVNADLAVLREILDVVAAHRLAETPAVRQARLLLRRAVACAGIAAGYSEAAQATSAG